MNRFHKRQEISSPVEPLLAAQEELCSMEIAWNNLDKICN
jgi:hypothetical protein